MSSLLAVPGLIKTSAWFRWELVNIGRRLNINPDYLSNVMGIESGFNPAATNPYGAATGLIQFMPATAERLGTTTGALRAMSAEDQLQYVEAFYKPFAGRLHNPGDAYMATFMPAFVGKPSSFVLGQEGSNETISGLSKGTIYEQNAGLDQNHDGYLTVGDVTAVAENRYHSVSARIEVPEEEPLRPKAAGASGQWDLGLPSSPAALPITIRRGARGREVINWQLIVGALPDGIFGSVTEALTMAWQSANDLVADGIVGPKTWKKALG